MASSASDAARSAGSCHRAVVERGVLVEGRGRDVAEHLAVGSVEDAEAARRW